MSDDDDDDQQQATARPARLIGRPPVSSNCRPQLMARSLLREEFEPDKSATCIDNPISFNEANAMAKRLRPWARGISWNSKRLTWSVRFWKDDGRTLIATSIPARKHGGVEQAFRKAVALRNRSFIHVLARVAADCQAEGRELPNLRWSSANHHWTAEDQGETKVLPAQTEDEVKSAWRAGVQWLASREDANAAKIDLDSVEKSFLASTAIRASRLSFRQGDQMSEQARESDIEEEQNNNAALNQMFAAPTSSQRRTSELSIPGEEEEDATAAVPADDGDAPYNVDEDVESKRHSNAVATLQPFPRGLIWARTTSRFFAVFRDPMCSSVNNKKKRFKTFDPKKFGGVNGAFNAASAFLSSVEPWETKSKRSERRKSVMPKRRGRHSVLLMESDAVEVADDCVGGQGIDYSRRGETEHGDQRLLSNGDNDDGKGCNVEMKMESPEVVLPAETESVKFSGDGDDEDDDVAETMTETDGDVNNNMMDVADDNKDGESSNAALASAAQLFPSAQHGNQATQEKDELQSIPVCDAIRWCPNEKLFLATDDDGKTKRFSPARSGALRAWHQAFQWVEERKEKIAKRSSREKENLRQNIRRSKQMQCANGNVEFNDEAAGVSQAETGVAKIVSRGSQQNCDEAFEREERKNVELVVVKEQSPEEQSEDAVEKSDVVITRTGRRSSAAAAIQDAAAQLKAESADEESDDAPPKTTRRRKKRKQMFREKGKFFKRSLSPESKAQCSNDDESGDQSRRHYHPASISKRARCGSSGKKRNTENNASPTTALASSNYARLANYVRKIGDENLYDSDDSCKDMTEQAKRLEKFSNISWVPQKQAFSVFYSKDVTAYNKTTKAFNPLCYHGVKRAYKQACIFGLRMMERKLFFNNSNSANGVCKNSNNSNDDDHEKASPSSVHSNTHAEW